MRIGLIDVDGHNFPNIPLMKLSAFHKQNGSSVEWYDPLFHSIGEPFDVVYTYIPCINKLSVCSNHRLYIDDF